MTPQDFKNNWKPDSDGQLLPISSERLTGFNLLPSTIAFLTTAGFPKCAMPVLSFKIDSDENDPNDFGISRLNELYDSLGSEYEKYVVIGTCRDLDPIAIDTKDFDKIVALNRKDAFTPSYFNSSIEALAEFLIIYRDFEEAIVAEHGVEGFRNAYFTDIQLEHFKARMSKVDPGALKEGNYWKEIFDMWISLRQQYMDS
jgi:hypothetical protein